MLAELVAEEARNTRRNTRRAYREIKRYPTVRICCGERAAGRPSTALVIKAEFFRRDCRRRDAALDSFAKGGGSGRCACGLSRLAGGTTACPSTLQRLPPADDSCQPGVRRRRNARRDERQPRGRLQTRGRSSNHGVGGVYPKVQTRLEDWETAYHGRT